MKWWFKIKQPVILLLLSFSNCATFILWKLSLKKNESSFQKNKFLKINHFKFALKKKEEEKYIINIQIKLVQNEYESVSGKFCLQWLGHSVGSGKICFNYF